MLDPKILIYQALLILAKSSQFLSSPKVTNAQTKLKLKITQLTLGGLAQMDRHWDKVLVQQVQIPLETANILLKLIYPSLRSNTKLTTLLTLCITGKLNNLTMGTTCFDTDFVSQTKLTTKPLIHCFVYAITVAV